MIKEKWMNGRMENGRKLFLKEKAGMVIAAGRIFPYEIEKTVVQEKRKTIK